MATATSTSWSPTAARPPCRCCSATATAPSQTRSTTPPAPIPSVAIADFNGDGTLDLAATNLNGGSVSVLLGNGDGTFDGATAFSAGTSPIFVAAANLDGLGGADLAVVGQGAPGVSVLLNNSTTNLSQVVHSTINVVDVVNDAVEITSANAIGEISEDNNQYEINGDFESGNFAGWMLTGANAFTTVNETADHSGDFGADIGPNASPVTLSQYVTTQSGVTYTLSFFVGPEAYVGGGAFSVSWDGMVIPLGPPASNPPGWFEYQVDVVGGPAASSTQLVFTFAADTVNYRHLDDVSVIGAEPKAQQSALGFVNFSDADLSDVHLVGFTAQDGGYVGSFSLDPIVSGAPGQGTVGWHFTVDNSALQSLAANEVVDQFYDITIDDQQGSTDVQTVTITLTGQNDRPELDGAVLAPVNEDIAEEDNDGQAVSTLYDGGFHDVDTGSGLAGIAVTANPANAATEGVWQYSTNGGTSWFDIGAVDTDEALLLSATSLLRFQPVLDFNGPPSSLQVYGLDDTFTGSFTVSAARETIDVAIGGGTSITSSATSIGITVNEVNDAPVAVDDVSTVR